MDGTDCVSTDCVRVTDTIPETPPYLGDPEIHPGSGIKTEFIHLTSPRAIVHKYTLLSAGDVWHICPSSKETADRLILAYQHEAIKPGSLLQRKPLANSSVKGLMLSQQFAVNSGQEYKYNVSSSSITLSESPTCVQEALGL